PMGEIAEMMLDGTLCVCCGGYLDGEGQGFARYCRGCCPRPGATATTDRVRCKVCGKRIKKAGERDHMRNKHQEQTNG
ncbi:MAG: hypothetical protein KGH75_14460, partial [Rhodospirillales bacterium]|nr:hypothetical protein [Rhodospirillales bacterium]